MWFIAFTTRPESGGLLENLGDFIVVFLFSTLLLICIAGAILINKITLFVDHKQLRIHNSSCPWWNDTFQNTDVKNIYTKTNHVGNEANRPSHDIYLVLPPNKEKKTFFGLFSTTHVKILRGLHSKLHAKRIKQDLYNFIIRQPES